MLCGLRRPYWEVEVVQGRGCMLQVGFYGSGITMDKARAAVEALQAQKEQAEGKTSSPAPDLPFGRDSKRIFESAAEVRPTYRLHFTIRTLSPFCRICRNAADIEECLTTSRGPTNMLLLHKAGRHSARAPASPCDAVAVFLRMSSMLHGMWAHWDA